LYVAGTRGPATGGGATGVDVRVRVAVVLLCVAVDSAVVLNAGDCVTMLVVLVAVALVAVVALVVVPAVDECDVPPHAANSSAQSSPEHSAVRLMFPAYSADIRRNR
jgi:hypothetical protein